MVSFTHQDAGTSEDAWAASGLAALPELPLDDGELAGQAFIVLAAHPDDESLGAGGLMARLRRLGARVTVLLCTAGEASHPDSPTTTPEQLAAVRLQEFGGALTHLLPDPDWRFLALPDGKLAAHRAELASALQQAIADLTAQIAALQTASTEAQRALERQLTERDRELDQLRMDLEVARLTPPAPTDLGPNEEELRLAELERRRIAEAEARAERIASPMIAFSGMGAGTDRENSLEAARLNEDEAFVRAGARPAPVTRAEVIVNPGNTVVQGTMIQAVTETALDSTLPGAIRAIVSEDVHSFDGTRVLIPRGARLVGRYRSDVALAQSRVMVAWDRIILPDNQTVEISAFGGDELGRTGTTGFVDTRFAQRFGSAALISLIGALPAAAAGQIEDEAAADIASDVGTDLRDSTQSVMQDYLAIRPVIHVDQGTRITVMVDRDLEIF